MIVKAFWAMLGMGYFALFTGHIDSATTFMVGATVLIAVRHEFQQRDR